MNVLVKKVFLRDANGLIEWLNGHKRVQVVNPVVVAGPTHARHSVLEVLKAFDQGTNIAKSPEIELLVRISGERQVNKALEKAGASEEKAVFICWADDCERVWNEFKKEFVKEEIEFKDPGKRTLLEAMEKTAIFWMRS